MCLFVSCFSCGCVFLFLVLVVDEFVCFLFQLWMSCLFLVLVVDEFVCFLF